jgi:hypothetical protein
MAGGGMAGLGLALGLTAYSVTRKPKETEAQKERKVRDAQRVKKHRDMKSYWEALGRRSGTVETDPQWNTAKGIKHKTRSISVGLKNAYLYNDPMFPTLGPRGQGKAERSFYKGMKESHHAARKNMGIAWGKRKEGSRLDVDSRLSKLALMDPDNPKNALRMRKQAALWDFEKSQHESLKEYSKTLQKWKDDKKAKMKAAFITAGISLAMGWASGEGLGFSTDFSGGKGGNLFGKMAKGFGFNKAKPLNHAAMKRDFIGGAMDAGYSRGQARKMYYNAYPEQKPWRFNRPNNWLPGEHHLMHTPGRGRHDQSRWLAEGGSIRDNVPAMLMGGEYVINRDAVDKLGVDFFDKLNRGEIPRFQTGGLVPGGASTGRDIDAVSGAGSQVNNITIEVNIEESGNAIVSSKEGGKVGEEGRNLAETIRKQVIKVLVDQKRQGGLLSGSGTRGQTSG